MMRRLARLSALIWATWLPAAAAGADLLLEGELGGWLDDVAAELGETLARHPRFQGETLRLLALTPGDPSGRSNLLAQAMERRLRQRLLSFDGVRLATEQPQRGCEPPQQIGYLVRLELTTAGPRGGRVHVAIVDVAEAVWVSGISHEWQGGLSAAEREALRTPVAQARPGTAGSPIPLQDAGAVAAALKDHLACTLPRDLDGGLYVAVPEARDLSRVALELQSELMYESLAALTAEPGDAHWLLRLETEDTVADVRELNLTLTDADGGRRQRVASVFVTNTRVGFFAAAPPDVPADPPAVAPPEAAPSVTAGLLSALQMRPARPEGICDDRIARINSCVEVSFELNERAYLFVISTRNHDVVEAPCGGDLERVDRGQRRYRLRVPPGRYAVDAADTGPDAGFYVLAVQDRAVARRLGEALAAAPGACRTDAATEAGDWLAAVGRVLDRFGPEVTWRALHVAHDSTGIVAL